MQKKLKSRNEELVHFSGEIGRIYIYIYIGIHVGIGGRERGYLRMIRTHLCETFENCKAL